MGTIDQPKPTEPKAPQPEQRPLQPGQRDTGSPKDASPQRPNLRDEEPLNLPERKAPEGRH